MTDDDGKIVLPQIPTTRKVTRGRVDPIERCFVGTTTEEAGKDTFVLRLDGGTQPRERLDEATVQRYAEAMAGGLWTFREADQAVAFHDGIDCWLADGFHRLEAAKRAGAQYLKKFSVMGLDIREGTLRDAILHSVAANAQHGLQRTDADKRRAVSRLLADPEWQKWSDREIARRCRVSTSFVTKQRTALTVHVDSEPAVVTGRAATERTYKTKHGTTATMRTSRIGRKPKPAQRADVEPVGDPATLDPPEADDPTAVEVQHDSRYWTMITAIRAIDAADLEELAALLRDVDHYAEFCAEAGDPHLFLSQAESVMTRLRPIIDTLKGIIRKSPKKRTATPPTHEGGGGTLH